MELAYTLAQWNGLTQYKCQRCPFDALDERAMEAHIAERHMPKPLERRPVAVTLFDSKGNLITEV